MNYNFLNLLPDELINQIFVFLPQKQVSVISDVFGYKIDYQYLLSEVYPAFNEMIKILREKHERFKVFDYKLAYDQMVMLNVLLARLNIKINIYTKDVKDFIVEIVNGEIEINFIRNLISSY